ncbi:MAG: FtsX-like permease family protein [Candidatus Aminicenantes bacterium]|nr:FtsX-like permease family protein [Candidatus Aminicenantes bacterium]
MIKFLIKGVLRDRSRSLFPVLTVTAGVFLTVVGFSWINGIQSNWVEVTAKYNTGHLDVMTRAYAEESEQSPIELAYIGLDQLLNDLRQDFPELIWTPRIKFGGLLDIPDENGETKVQGPCMGMAVDLFSKQTPDINILNLQDSVIRGRLPEKPSEILITEEFAQRLGVSMGQTATLISSTMYGSMAITNFSVTGTVRFGVSAMDRSTIIADISDIQNALNMENASGEVLGFFRDNLYENEKAQEIAQHFNSKYSDQDDEFSPIMSTLIQKSGLEDILGMVNMYGGVIIFVFVVVMSIVLWNAGLMGSLRRYGEIGVRMAIGEDKGHLYRSLIIESLIIGFIGSVLGTIIGLGLSFYLQAKGINIAYMMKNSTLMISDTFRANVTSLSYYVGFIPGMLATFLGSVISGLGIYKRKTSQLMKELET